MKATLDRVFWAAWIAMALLLLVEWQPAQQEPPAPPLTAPAARHDDDAQACVEAERMPWEEESGGDALPYGASESRGYAWTKARDAFKKANPKCAACGCAGPLAIHHILAWRNCTGENEWKRLDHSNLISLCTCDGGGSDGRGKHQCHWRFGHLSMSWKASNPSVRDDCERFLKARATAKRAMELETNPESPDTTICR